MLAILKMNVIKTEQCHIFLYFLHIFWFKSKMTVKIKSNIITILKICQLTSSMKSSQQIVTFKSFDYSRIDWCDEDVCVSDLISALFYACFSFYIPV